MINDRPNKVLTFSDDRKRLTSAMPSHTQLTKQRIKNWLKTLTHTKSLEHFDIHCCKPSTSKTFKYTYNFDVNLTYGSNGQHTLFICLQSFIRTTCKQKYNNIVSSEPKIFF